MLGGDDGEVVEEPPGPAGAVEPGSVVLPAKMLVVVGPGLEVGVGAVVDVVGVVDAGVVDVLGTVVLGVVRGGPVVVGAGM